MTAYAIGIVQGVLLAGLAYVWYDHVKLRREIKAASEELTRLEQTYTASLDVSDFGTPA